MFLPALVDIYFISVNNFMALIQVRLSQKLGQSYPWPQGTRWLNFGRSRSRSVGEVYAHWALLVFYGLSQSSSEFPSVPVGWVTGENSVCEKWKPVPFTPKSFFPGQTMDENWRRTLLTQVHHKPCLRQRWWCQSTTHHLVSSATVVLARNLTSFSMRCAISSYNMHATKWTTLCT